LSETTVVTDYYKEAQVSKCDFCGKDLGEPEMYMRVGLCCASELAVATPSASDNQLKAEILPIVDRALLDVIDGNCDKAILSLNKLTAKLSAV
jgi:hypothetical protein